jgi:hypothetical protein
MIRYSKLLINSIIAFSIVAANTNPEKSQYFKQASIRGLVVSALSTGLHRTALDYSAFDSIMINFSISDESMGRVSPAFKRVFEYWAKTTGAVIEPAIETTINDHILIIIPDSFQAAISSLYQWKTEQNFDVTITTLSDIGSTTDSIKTYIQSVYDYWPAPASHLLLAAHSSLIPTFAGGNYPDSTANFDYPTDLYYATMDGPDDVLPDLFVGRLPARNAAELTNMITKIITYEQSDPSSSAWRMTGSFIASGDPNFADLVENTHRYPIAKYFAENNLIADSIWVASGGNTIDIQATVNNGTNIVCYSGHGTEYVWQDPNTNPLVFFWNQNINELTNTGQYPIVLSFGCNAGIYGTASPSLGESWLLAQNRGAVSFLGSSGITFWYEDDYFERRFWDAAFSGYLLSLGEMSLSAILQVWARGYPTGDYYPEIYNLLGDPSLAFSFFNHDSVRQVLSGLALNQSTGSPIVDQELEITPIGDSAVQPFVVVTDSLGYFAAPGSLPLASYRISARRSGYHDFADTVEIGPAAKIDTIYFRPFLPATIAGIIYESDGSLPLEGAIIRLRGSDLRDTTGVDGTYLLDNITSSVAVIDIQKRGYIGITDTLIITEGEFLSGVDYYPESGPNERYFGFELDVEDFSFNGDWERGIPGTSIYLSGPGSAYAGDYAVATKADNNYSPRSNSILESPAIYIADFSHLTLAFYHYFQMDQFNSGFDGGNVKISTDTGLTWELIDPINGYSVTELSTQNDYLGGEPAFSGSQPHWQYVQFNLDHLLGTAEEIRLRFHFASTAQSEDAGWYLDDIAMLNRLPLSAAGNDPVQPDRFTLGQNYPNPFNRTTTIPLTLSDSRLARLKIYDLAGQEIRSIVLDKKSGGHNLVNWDGNENSGLPVASGIYFYLLEQDNQVLVRKMILIK